MFPRLCKICCQANDVSIIKLRKFSVKNSKDFPKYSTNNEFEFKEESVKLEDIEKIKKKRTLIIKCKNSQLDFYKGDTYPKFKPIPLASRGWHHRKSNGDYFTIYPADTENEQVNSSLSFRNMDLNEQLVTNLEENGINHPTLIQRLGLPQILNQNDVILTAETGCGKTFAFLIPLLQQILQWKRQRNTNFNSPLGLILVPSRELAIQITKEAKKLAKNLNVNIVKLVGGRTKKMIQNPQVGEVDLMIATVGCLSKLITTKIYKMEGIKHVVLDEADTLFDTTFSDRLIYILRHVNFKNKPNEKAKSSCVAQLTLNSATIPENLPIILNNIVNCDSFVQVSTGSEHQIKVPQKFFKLTGKQKPQILLKIVKQKAKNKIPIIIFSNTTASCDFTKLFLEGFNINCINLHGSMPALLRRGRFAEFQNGKYTVLSTTDAGARGLDTTIAKDIINYDFPLITADYIHRCGRVGRIGSPQDCRIYNFISQPLEIILTRKIEFATRKMKPIPMTNMLKNEPDEETNFLGSENNNYNNEKSLSNISMINDTNKNFSYEIS